MSSEARKEVKAYRVYLICEKDGCEGHLEFTGMARASLPTQYQNKCNRCGHTEWARHGYPTIRYEEVGGE